MKWIGRILDLITAVGSTLAVLGGTQTISPKWAAIGGAAAGIAGKLASTPSWMGAKAAATVDEAAKP